MAFYLLICLFFNWCTWGFLELIMSGITSWIRTGWEQTAWVAGKGSGRWILHWRWANSKFSLQLGKLSYLQLKDSWPGDYKKLFPLSTQCCCLGWTWNTGSSGRTSRIWVGSGRKLHLLWRSRQQECSVLFTCGIVQRRRGLPRGAVVSPFLKILMTCIDKGWPGLLLMKARVFIPTLASIFNKLYASSIVISVRALNKFVSFRNKNKPVIDF